MSSSESIPALDRNRSTAELLQQTVGPIALELARVAERILAELADPLAQRVVYLITAGGKRLRPAMVLLTGLAGPSPRKDALIDAAAAVELIHTATLIHDDIIDLSTLRRKQSTFHERWGTERALLTGDYLYATAFALLARLDDPVILRIMADVCQELSRGELREVEARHRLDLSESEYFAIIRDKTASLTGACCRIGAQLGGFKPDAVARWDAFGIHVGLAFQIIDDCLDLAGDPQEIGKSILSDLDKGTLSLPMIYLAQELDPQERLRVFAPVGGEGKSSLLPAHDSVMIARVAELAQSRGTIERAQRRAALLIDEAKAGLAGISLGAMADACEALAAYAVSRRS